MLSLPLSLSFPLSLSLTLSLTLSLAGLAVWLGAAGGLSKNTQRAIARNNLTGKTLLTFAKKHVGGGRLSVLMDVFGVTLSLNEEDR